MSLGLSECAFMGVDGKMYYNSATYASPTWVEIDEVSDVNIPEFNDTMAEVPTRSGEFVGNKPGKTRVAVEATYLYRANDPVWQYLKGQKLAKEPIDLAVCDGDISVDTTEGLRMVCYMEQFPISQPTEEMMTHDVLRFVPAHICDAQGKKVDPYWFHVDTGAIVPESTAMAALATPATVQEALVKGCCSRMNPVLLSKLVAEKKLKIFPAFEKVTVEEAIRKRPELKERMSWYPPEMIVYTMPGSNPVPVANK